MKKHHVFNPIPNQGWLTMSPASGGPGPLLLASTTGGSEDKPTVRAERRRKTTTPPGERERAEAPQRRDDGAPPPSSGSGGGYTPRPAGGGASGGMGRGPVMGGGVTLLIVLCLVIYFFVFGGNGSDQGTLEQGSIEEQGLAATEASAEVAEAATPRPIATPRPRPTARPTAQPGSTAATTGSDGQRWLVMLYQDADDKVLEQDIVVDMNEAERTGSSDNVQVVSQLDRYRGGYQGDGNWTTTKRYHITRDQMLNRVDSEEVADIGEANMADGETLVDFVTWAMETYPADKYALILSDHGMGWPGGWSDPTATGGADRNIPLSTRLGDVLYLNEIDQALGEIRARTGLDKFELIGMDACLMGHLEVFSALAPHARYAVASQETEPALGWAYTGFLDALSDNPAMDGAELGRLIVDSYIQDDQRIVDDEARAEFVGRGGRIPSASQVAQQLEENITLTAMDMGGIPALMQSVNDLTFVLQQSDQRGVAKSRRYAQSFTSIFGSQAPPSYVDLGNFAQLLQSSTDSSDVVAAADAVISAIASAVVSEKHGPGKPGASGVSVYFPNSQLYSNPYSGPQSYTAVADRFAAESTWDDFLAFHYTGKPFESDAAAPAVPERGVDISSPASGGITVSSLELSDDTAAPGQPVLISADIGGANVGHVKLLVGYFDAQAKSINWIDTDYLQSVETREVDGVYYPVWPEGEFRMEFEWEPIVFAVTDGQTTAPALFKPESYGRSQEEATYTVDGIYNYADGETRNARLYFQDGVMRQVFSFTGDESTGAPREILPQPGDTFTLLETWLDLDDKGGVEETVTQEGATLTFGNEPFRWKDLDAAAGRYIVGFIVEDLDGAQTPTYGQVTVR